MWTAGKTCATCAWATQLRKEEHCVSPPAETMAKAALYVAMGESGISKVQLAKRLPWAWTKKRCAAYLIRTAAPNYPASPKRLQCLENG